jgi:hypothetical protein
LYQVTITNKFATQEGLEDNGDINRAWDTIKEKIKISTEKSLDYCESKHHKPRFDEECSQLVDRMKQDNLQWLQDPNEMNEDNLSYVRREASRHIRNKRVEYLKYMSLNQTVRIKISEIFTGA